MFPLEGETQQQKSRRLRRSLILLPADVVGIKGKKSLLSRSLIKAGVVGAAIGGVAAGAAYIFGKKTTDDFVGDATPDFGDVKVDSASTEPIKPPPQPRIEGKADVDKAVATVKATEVKVAPIPDTLPAPKVEAKESLIDKVKSFFTKKDAIPANPAGISYASALTSKLDQSYRTHQDFAGFPGADSLSKYGAYTDAEAARIRELRSSGANTSANAGAMSVDIENRIRYFARKHQVDEEASLKMAQMESGGNPNAISSTGAIGIFQFTGRTASGMGVTDRFDINQNIEAGILLAKQSVAKLSDGGLPITPVNIYLMHQLGVSGAKELIAAAAAGKPLSALSESARKAVGFNYGGNRASTAQEYIAMTEAALVKRSVPNRFASQSSETTPVVASLAPASIARVNVPASATTVNALPNAKPVTVTIPDAPVESKQQGGDTQIASADSAVTRVRAPSAPTSSPQSIMRTPQGILINVS